MARQRKHAPFFAWFDRSPAGKGIAELQEGGYIGTTVIEWVPRLPFLGIYPTAQSLALQALLLVLAAVALVWFVVRRAPAAPPRG